MQWKTTKIWHGNISSETMGLLFEIPPVFPGGFSYFPDFITVEEEAFLIEKISAIPLKPFVFHGFSALRKTASYGFDYSFSSGKLSESQPIPSAFQPIIARVAAVLQVPSSGIAELLLTEYPPGSVINWHRDAPPFGVIAGISLQSDCTFRLRPNDPKMQGRKAIVSFTAKRRSLYIIAGESRSEWQHSIAPVTHTRYSITLRTLK